MYPVLYRVKTLEYYIGCVGEINAIKDLILELVRYGISRNAPYSYS
ncbi:hypothetical protein NIES4075_38970 [Tolypothrix sp. NIES-4075]|nr:hypothetical protein NIES4075_38970 [Tolypothrix sp. NIES-4075]